MLFAEEPGVVLQVRRAEQAAVLACLRQHGLADCTRSVSARPHEAMRVRIRARRHAVAR